MVRWVRSAAKVVGRCRAAQPQMMTALPARGFSSKEEYPDPALTWKAQPKPNPPKPPLTFSKHAQRRTEELYPDANVPYRGSSDSPVREGTEFPSSGIAYMGGIRNFQTELDHAAYKPDQPVTVGHAKKQGFVFHTPMREYYLPEHWKYSKTHLLCSIEFDTLHVWVRPPNDAAFPPTPLSTLSEEEQKEKWPFFVPVMQKMSHFEDDWVITDVHTNWTKTPTWVVPAFERFLGFKLHAEGTPEHEELADQYDKAELQEDPSGWLGQNYFRSMIAKENKSAPDTIASENPDQDELGDMKVTEEIFEEFEAELKEDAEKLAGQK